MTELDWGLCLSCGEAQKLVDGLIGHHMGPNYKPCRGKGQKPRLKVGARHLAVPIGCPSCGARADLDKATRCCHRHKRPDGQICQRSGTILSRTEAQVALSSLVPEPLSARFAKKRRVSATSTLTAAEKRKRKEEKKKQQQRKARQSSTSVRTVSGGLPTLGKRC